MTTTKILMVNVLSDGRGDLYHYIDFIKQIPSNELFGWHFIVAASGDDRPGILVDSPLRDTKWIWQALLHSFDKDHPIFTNLTIFASRNSEPCREVKNYLDDIAKESKHLEIFHVSTPICMWPLYEGSEIKVFEFLWAEHSGAECKLSGQFRPIEYLGIYKNSVGIFLPKEENYDVLPSNIQMGLQKIGLSSLDGIVPLICYGHSDIEFMLQQVLAIISNLTTTKKIALLIPNKFKDSKSKLQLNKLAENHAVYWYDHIDDATFEYLRNVQLPISFAAGDKTLEFCIASGRLPIIETKIERKREHLNSLISILENFVNQELLDVSLYAATNIINYFKNLVSLDEANYIIERAEQNPLDRYGSDVPSFISVWHLEADEAKRNIAEIKRKTAELFEKDVSVMIDVWRDKICPYLRVNFNANNKVVPWFRLMQNLSALAVTDDKIELEKCSHFSGDVLQLVDDFIFETSQTFQYNPTYIQIVDKIIANAQQQAPKKEIIDALQDCNNKLLEIGQEMQGRADDDTIRMHNKFQRLVEELLERVKSEITIASVYDEILKDVDVFSSTAPVLFSSISPNIKNVNNSTYCGFESGFINKKEKLGLFN